MVSEVPKGKKKYKTITRILHNIYVYKEYQFKEWERRINKRIKHYKSNFGYTFAVTSSHRTIEKLNTSAF